LNNSNKIMKPQATFNVTSKYTTKLWQPK
jgi:hypothetical protein